MHSKIEIGNKQIRSVTYLGVWTNIALSLVKVLAGVWSGSLSLVADGAHSISDTVTDFAVLLGVYFGSKEPDPKHPYGHGRIETFSSVAVAIILVLVGGLMVYRASIDIAKTPEEDGLRELSYVVLFVAILSVIVKEALYRVTKKIAIKTESSALYANAAHHRSDAGSSVAVVIGFVTTKFGYVHGDNIAAVVVGIMIILVAVKIIASCVEEFAEQSVDLGTVEQIKRVISSEERIHDWHKLRTRSVGREIFLDLHILVDPDLSITEAHEIAESLENDIHRELVRPVNIVVHVEPDMPELRK